MQKNPVMFEKGKYTHSSYLVDIITACIQYCTLKLKSTCLCMSKSGNLSRLPKFCIIINITFSQAVTV